MCHINYINIFSSFENFSSITTSKINFTAQFKASIPHNCYSPHSGKIYLTVESIHFLASLDGTILLANLVLNILVIIVIVKTREISNTSGKLIFNLSIADVVHGLNGQ